MIKDLLPSHLPIIIRSFAILAPIFFFGYLVGTFFIRLSKHQEEPTRRSYRKLHRFWQLSMTVFLITSFLVFEFEIHYRGWRHIAQLSPYYSSWVFPVLFLHLFFALATVFILFLLLHGIYQWGPSAMLVKTKDELQMHRKLGNRFLWFLFFTWITGWWVYGIAFLSAKGFNITDM